MDGEAVELRAYEDETKDEPLTPGKREVGGALGLLSLHSHDWSKNPFLVCDIANGKVTFYLLGPS